MYRGLPVITAGRGGPVNFVNNNVNGFLCNAPNEYSRAFDQLLSNTGIRQEFGKMSKKIAEQYKSSYCAQRLVSAYQRQIEKKQSH
jgi:glycosyltransferase involved in cell wall biosynthesis